MLDKIKNNKVFASLLAVYMLGLFIVINYVGAAIDHDIGLSRKNHGLIVYIACEKELEATISNAKQRHDYCWEIAEKTSGIELEKS